MLKVKNEKFHKLSIKQFKLASCYIISNFIHSPTVDALFNFSIKKRREKGNFFTSTSIASHDVYLPPFCILLLVCIHIHKGFTVKSTSPNFHAQIFLCVFLLLCFNFKKYFFLLFLLIPCGLAHKSIFINHSCKL